MFSISPRVGWMAWAERFTLPRAIAAMVVSGWLFWGPLLAQRGPSAPVAGFGGSGPGRAGMQPGGPVHPAGRTFPGWGGPFRPPWGGNFHWRREPGFVPYTYPISYWPYEYDGGYPGGNPASSGIVILLMQP